MRWGGGTMHACTHEQGAGRGGAYSRCAQLQVRGGPQRQQQKQQQRNTPAAAAQHARSSSAPRTQHARSNSSFVEQQQQQQQRLAGRKVRGGSPVAPPAAGVRASNAQAGVRAAEDSN